VREKWSVVSGQKLNNKPYLMDSAIEQRLEALGKSKFRNTFKLPAKELGYLTEDQIDYVVQVILRWLQMHS